MAITVRYRVVNKTRGQLVDFIHSIPGRYAGKVADYQSIALTMRSRLVQSFFKAVYQNYVVKREGKAGRDDITWMGATQNSLAYRIPFKGKRGRPLAGAFAPNGNDGRMTKAQLNQWYEIYALTLSRVIGNFGVTAAKGISAAHAWTKMKEIHGDDIAKLHHREFGKRLIGEYYIGDTTGDLMKSYDPSPAAGPINGIYVYPASSDTQFVDLGPKTLSAGSRIKYSGDFDNKRTIVPETWTPTNTDDLARGIAESVFYAARIAAEGTYKDVPRIG